MRRLSVREISDAVLADNGFKLSSALQAAYAARDETLAIAELLYLELTDPEKVMAMGPQPTDDDVLLPAEAARRLGVPTRVIVQAMYERTIPRRRLADGTLGIPADALDSFKAADGR